MVESAENYDHWCFAWFERDPTASVVRRAALLKEAKWQINDSITVAFLDGDQSVHERVRRVALQYVSYQMANLRFEFRRDITNTDVRISFKYPGSWSVIGTTCRDVKDTSRPTMNFGGLNPGVSNDALRAVVLHEFGHALGMIHEHQNPHGKPIRWNRPAVLEDLKGPPNNWDVPTIERNVFEPHKRSEINGTAVDPKSIMMYPIPRRWTTSGFSSQLNQDLSDGDMRFLRKQYPY